MLIENKSNKIIGIGLTSVLPGGTTLLPAGYENNPILKKYAEEDKIRLIKDEDSDKLHIAPSDEGNQEAEDKKLEEMTEDELKIYAAEKSIDLGKASSKEGILKKIQEVEKAANES